jgi:hypothetical protein
MTLCTIGASQGRAQPGNPTPALSASVGYKAGDIYINSTDNTVWVCISAAVGRAVWAEIEIKRAVGLFNQIPAGEIMDTRGL